MNKDNSNIKQDKEEEQQRQVKQLNQEIMLVFEKHAAIFRTCFSSFT